MEGEKYESVFIQSHNCVVRRENLRFLSAVGGVALFRDIIPHQLTIGSGHFEFITLLEADPGDREF